jgi:hypothetical protein
MAQKATAREIVESTMIAATKPIVQMFSVINFRSSSALLHIAQS